MLESTRGLKDNFLDVRRWGRSVCDVVRHRDLQVACSISLQVLVIWYIVRFCIP